MRLFIYLVVCISLITTSCKKNENPSAAPKPDIVHQIVNKTVKAADPNPLTIDVNGDGLIDYSYFAQYLANSSGVHLYVGVNPIGDNSTKMSPPNDEHFQNMGDAASIAKGLEINNNMLPSRLWSGDFAYLAIRHDYYPINKKAYEGDWSDEVNRYMPLKLNIKGSVHYGWAKLQFNRNSEELMLVDIAWNRNADQEIKAGFY